MIMKELVKQEKEETQYAEAYCEMDTGFFIPSYCTMSCSSYEMGGTTCNVTIYNDEESDDILF
jgi:hypothetical protein